MKRVVFIHKVQLPFIFAQDAAGNIIFDPELEIKHVDNTKVALYVPRDMWIYKPGWNPYMEYRGGRWTQKWREYLYVSTNGDIVHNKNIAIYTALYIAKKPVRSKGYTLEITAQGTFILTNIDHPIIGAIAHQPLLRDTVFTNRIVTVFIDPITFEYKVLIAGQEMALSDFLANAKVYRYKNFVVITNGRDGIILPARGDRILHTPIGTFAADELEEADSAAVEIATNFYPRSVDGDLIVTPFIIYDVESEDGMAYGNTTHIKLVYVEETQEFIALSDDIFAPFSGEIEFGKHGSIRVGKRTFIKSGKARLRFIGSFGDGILTLDAADGPFRIVENNGVLKSTEWSSDMALIGKSGAIYYGDIAINPGEEFEGQTIVLVDDKLKALDGLDVDDLEI